MSRIIDRQESMRIAAERVKLKKEKEEREEREFYERITTGTQWLIFKSVVVLCTSIVLLTTFEVLVDGSTKKLTEKSWEIDRDWEYPWHKVLNVEGYMFTPTFADWYGRVENDLAITYSPIFRTGKKLVYDIKVDEFSSRTHEEIRQRSIFTWFPTFQLFLLIPLITMIFKRQSAWFNFARIASLVLVLPGGLLVVYFSLMA